MWEWIDLYEGRIIISLLLIVVIREFYKIISRWGKAPPVTYFEILSTLDRLSINNGDAKKLIQRLLDESSLDIKNFITEETRRQEKRKWDEDFNEKRSKDE